MQITLVQQRDMDVSSAISVAVSGQQSAPTVFLHTTWRTGGTWLWSRFCALPGTAGFYEPLHEGLRTLRSQHLGSLHANLWESGHPLVDAGYFERYRPLVEESGGVAGFPMDEGPHHFFAPDNADLPEIRSYLARLLETDGTPVLKFCRSLGRLGWMRRQFPAACHIILSRNPASQWASMQRQKLQQGNSYFTLMPERLLLACRDQPQVATAIRAMRLDGDHSAGERAYRAFLAFWLLTNCFDMAESDVSLNFDLLAMSQPYRASCEYEVLAATGLAVDLAGVRPSVATRLDPAWLGVPTIEVLRCHWDAMGYVLHAGLSDSSIGRVAGALSHANSLVFGRSGALQATTVRRSAACEMTERADQPIREALAFASQRAITAEAQLRDIEASRCWAVTQPLRRVGEWLKTWHAAGAR